MFLYNCICTRVCVCVCLCVCVCVWCGVVWRCVSTLLFPSKYSLFLLVLHYYVHLRMWNFVALLYYDYDHYGGEVRHLLGAVWYFAVSHITHEQTSNVYFMAALHCCSGARASVWVFALSGLATGALLRLVFKF